MMRIAIGSTNPVKCNAARAVLTPLYPDAELVCLDVPSGVSGAALGRCRNTDRRAQPGARRARTNRRRSRGRAGRRRAGVRIWAAHRRVVCAGGPARSDRRGRQFVRPAAASVAADVRQGIELGAAMDRLVNKQNTKHQNGAIGILTNNLETRQSAYEMIIRLALAPFQNPDWYPVSAISRQLHT